MVENIFCVGNAESRKNIDLEKLLLILCAHIIFRTLFNVLILKLFSY